MTIPPNRSGLLQLARGTAVLRTRDLEAQGVNRVALGRLVEKGLIERVGRGLYALPNAKVTEHHTLVEASVRVPAGLVCLLSALQFDKLSTQSPHEVWLAVAVKARKPAVDWPPLHIVRFSGAALTHGIETHVIERTKVRVTSPAKTVADCFKYRNKIGLDVAIEALTEYRRKRGSVDALMAAAAVDRVAVVMRPYVEAVR
ncbi:transcriptional regulator [bacterium]|nr:MAG: transcriptional regulator [bacterium]